MPRDFFPRRDADVLPWSANLARRLEIDYEMLGLSLGEAQHYRATHERFAEAYWRAENAATRTRSAIVQRNVERVSLEAEARGLVTRIYARPEVSDGLRVELGLRPRRRNPSRIPRPTNAPLLAVAGVVGQVVRLRLADPDAPTRCRIPDGVQAADLYVCLASSMPDGSDEWQFAGRVTRAITSVTLRPGIDSDHGVWVKAAWSNFRGETGPFCLPVAIRVAYAGPLPDAGSSGPVARTAHAWGATCAPHPAAW